MTLILTDINLNGFKDIFLYSSYCTSLIFGILTVNSYNPIISVLYLILLFCSVAVCLIEIGIIFIGISYILVYVGAVSILFIFILMLVNIRISELLSPTSNSIPLGVIIIMSLYSILMNVNISNKDNLIKINSVNNKNEEIGIAKDIDQIKHNTFDYVNENIDINNLENINKTEDYIFNEINFSTSKNWEAMFSGITDITNLGTIMYSSYSIWLLLTSPILLLGMCGSIVITIK